MIRIENRAQFQERMDPDIQDIVGEHNDKSFFADNRDASSAAADQ
ncbi:hypothetical protein [Paenibacillus sacheonensis]|nr:hypothetical protein [Paenibacillus sacheonensis]MBM7564078.1 hypothetical protein [Paenibacillus sacheonensis]